MIIKKIFSSFCFVVFSIVSYAQILNELSTKTITLDNGEVVILLEAMDRNGNNTNKWYYLPSASFFTIPKTSEGKLDYSLILYTADADDSACNSIEDQGGIFHGAIKWKISKDQENEIKQKLKEEVGDKANLMGVVTSLKGEELNFITVLKGGAIGKDNGKKFMGTSFPPTKPGSVIGVQKSLSIQDSRLIQEEILSGNPSIDVEVLYSYSSQVPIGDVRIKFDWSSQEFSADKLQKKYNSWVTSRWEKNAKLKVGFPKLKAGFWGGLASMFKGSNAGIERKNEQNFSYDEMRSFFSFLEDISILKIEYMEYNFDNDKGESLKEKFRELVYKSIIPQMAIPQAPPTKNQPATKTNNESLSAKEYYIKDFKHYKINNKFFNKSRTQKKVEYEISSSIGITKQHPITISVGSLLGKCADCIQEFNLCSPFYQRIRIEAIPNPKTQAMLRDGILNYIAVSITKERPNDTFNANKTISYSSLNGVDALSQLTFKYARPKNDIKFNEYEYNIKFTSGNSSKVVEQTGKNIGELNINYPLRPINVELNDASRGQLRDLGFVKASVVIVYKQFNELRYSSVDFNYLRGDGGVIDQVIYIDEEAKDFSYYVILRNEYGEKLASKEYLETISQTDVGELKTEKKEIYIFNNLEDMDILIRNENTNEEIINTEKINELKKQAEKIFEVLKKIG